MYLCMYALVGTFIVFAHDALGCGLRTSREVDPDRLLSWLYRSRDVRCTASGTFKGRVRLV